MRMTGLRIVHSRPRNSIDMKIDAADLLDRPMLCKIDMVLNMYVLK
jgi:hypothetical protein